MLTMLSSSSPHHQTNLFGSGLLLQLDPSDPLLKLAKKIPWEQFDVGYRLKTEVLTIEETIKSLNTKPENLVSGNILLKSIFSGLTIYIDKIGIIKYQ